MSGIENGVWWGVGTLVCVFLILFIGALLEQRDKSRQ